MNEVELIATAILMDRTAGPAIEAGGRAVVDRIRTRLDSFLERTKERSGRAPLEVDDRMALKVLQEAGTVDDEVLKDYLGGVLLSSAGGHRQDQGSAVLATLSSLSTMQVRGHFAIYSALRRLMLGEGVNMYDDGALRAYTLFVDQEEFFAAVGVAPTEVPTPHPVPHVSRGLHRAELVGRHFGSSDAQMLHNYGLPDSDRPGLVVQPTSAGAELYLWGHGCEVLDANAFVDPSLVMYELLATPPALTSARFVALDRNP